MGLEWCFLALIPCCADPVGLSPAPHGRCPSSQDATTGFRNRKQAALGSACTESHGIKY